MPRPVTSRPASTIEPPTWPPALPGTTPATSGPSGPHATLDASPYRPACGGPLTVAFGNDRFMMRAVMWYGLMHTYWLIYDSDRNALRDNVLCYRELASQQMVAQYFTHGCNAVRLPVLSCQ